MKKIDKFLTATKTLLSPSQVSIDPKELSFFAQDWSNTFIPSASAVLFPETTEQVSAIMKIAHQHEIEIVPSGGRTGLSGGAVATKGEVILSLIRLNFMGPIHEGGLTLKVGAGAITEAVHQFCEPFGLTWPVDFASKGSSTIGGNIATNAGGVRVIRYGNTRNWVLGITAVGMDGVIHHFNHELEKNNTGYDFRQLLTGSEGTLAVITEATLKLCPKPSQTLVAFFSLKNFDSLIALFTECRRTFPKLSAFECLDQSSMSSVMSHFKLPLPVSVPGEVYALMEIENTDYSEIEGSLADLLEKNLAIDAVLAQNEKEAKALWHYREGVAESILHESQIHQEDVSVPVAALSGFYSQIQKRYAEILPGFLVHFFGHIGDGNLHVFIKKPDSIDKETFHQKAKDSDLELFKILKTFKGSVSAEHGIGLLKKHAIHFTREAPELDLMRAIKRSFDPKGLLNPGKILD